jgi:hypothetical protein
MRWLYSAVFAVLGYLAVPAQAGAPLSDPVALNIGISCQWQQRCIKDQKKAMKRALKFVKKSEPPLWRVQLCNRNAARQRSRVDWVGFDNCIRNSVLRPAAPARAVRKKSRRLPEGGAPPHVALGERG